MVGVVDDQPDARAQQRAVVGGGGAGAGGQLVQADPLDELRARVDKGDVDVSAQPQVVGCHRPGVSAADNDDVRPVAGRIG